MGDHYTAQAIIERSPQKNTIAALPKTEAGEIYRRVSTLIAENQVYCIRANDRDLALIFPTLALYEFYLEQGQSQEDAVDHALHAVVLEALNKAETYRRYSRIPGAMWLFGQLSSLRKRKSKPNRNMYTVKVADSRHLCMTCTTCIYAQILGKYDALDLGKGFCRVGAIRYSALRHITFTQEHTLCQDGQPCDFTFQRAS